MAAENVTVEVPTTRDGPNVLLSSTEGVSITGYLACARRLANSNLLTHWSSTVAADMLEEILCSLAKLAVEP
jgi:hypothetical protein